MLSIALLQHPLEVAVRADRDHVPDLLVFVLEQERRTLGAERVPRDAGEHLAGLLDGDGARALLEETPDRDRGAQVERALVAFERLLDRGSDVRRGRRGEARPPLPEKRFGAGSSSINAPIAPRPRPSGTASARGDVERSRPRGWNEGGAGVAGEAGLPECIAASAAAAAAPRALASQAALS